MLRRFVLLLCAMSLHAQIWQDPQTLISLRAPEIGAMREQTRLERGPRRETLFPPPTLEARKPLSWDHLDGSTYLLGLPRHPAYGPPTLNVRNPKSPYRLDHVMPLDLYRSRDFRTWEHLGRYVRDSHGRPQALHALRDGSFLGTGGPFWEGNAISPLARYRLDAKGILRFERLVDPGFNEPLFTPYSFASGSEEANKWGRGAHVSTRFMEVEQGPWECFRTSGALVALHRQSGWTLILDPKDGHVLARLHPYPKADLHRQNVAGRKLLIGAHPAPDGSLLIASRQPEIIHSIGTDFPELFLHWDRLQTGSSRQAYQLLRQRETQKRLFAGTEVMPRFPDIRWFRLDPARRSLEAIAPPPGAPTRMANVWEGFRLHVEVKPDGTVVRIAPPLPPPGILFMLRHFFW